MKTCNQCGYQNDNHRIKCKNCLIDLHWAYLNLESFSGTIHDTKRIGKEEHKRRGVAIGSSDTEVEEQNKTWDYFIFYTIGFALLIVLDITLLTLGVGTEFVLTLLCPITFGSSVALFATTIGLDKNKLANVVFIIGTLIGFIIFSFIMGTAI